MYFVFLSRNILYFLLDGFVLSKMLKFSQSRFRISRFPSKDELKQISSKSFVLIFLAVQNCLLDLFLFDKSKALHRLFREFRTFEFIRRFLSALNAIFFSAAAYFQSPLFSPVLDCSLLFRWSPWRRKTKFTQRRKTVEVSDFIYPFFSNLKESCRFDFYNPSKNHQEANL